VLTWAVRSAVVRTAAGPQGRHPGDGARPRAQGADEARQHHARGDDRGAQSRLGRARLARGDAPAGGARRRADQGDGGGDPGSAGGRQDAAALRCSDDRGAPRRKSGAPRLRTAMLSVAMLALPACASAPRVPTSAETLASLTHERQIVAVHYHALGTPGPLHNGARLVHGSVTMAAPTGWIKDRFVQSLEARLGLQQIRNVPEPRFAYLERERAAPDARALKRTFERGLVFDFYSPWQYLPAAGGRLYRASEIQVRLLRLDDLSLLWADSFR